MGVLDELASFEIPEEYRPGTDLISKIILKEEKVMNCIVEQVVGVQAIGSYSLGRCEWVNKTVSGVFYLPKTNEYPPKYPPILIEIQDKQTITFSLALFNIVLLYSRSMVCYQSVSYSL
jgi:hypothetical protein